MQLDAEDSALIVVDMQNGFCHPDGSLHSDGSEAAVQPCAELVDRARAAEVPVIFTKDTHTEDQFEGAHGYDEFQRWGRHVLEDTWDWEIVEELEPGPEDHVVTKHTYDAFHDTGLPGHLDAHGVTDLLFCGTLADVCVYHTAASAALRDHRVVVAQDAVGYIEPERRDCALRQVRNVFGETAPRDEVAFR